MPFKALTAAALLAGLTACGSAAAAPKPAAPSVPAGASEQVLLQAQITEKLSGQNITASDVRCPANVTAVEATVATCNGVVDGQTLNISVTFESENEIVVGIVP